jgi:hypothetical protein
MTTPIGSSRRARGARDSIRKRAAAATATIPMGTLTRKIGRQSRPSRSASISSPPTRGPVMVASPMVAPNIPKAPARSWGGKVTWMTERIWGNMIAPISPCSTREPISMPGLWASPQRAEASVNPAMPMMNSRLRPKMSPRRPPVISMTAKASW